MNFIKIKGLAASAGLAIVISAYAQADTLALETDEQVAAYGVGYGFAENLKQQTAGITLSEDAMIQGIRDAMAGNEMAVSEEDVQAAITALQQQLMEMQNAEAEAKIKLAHEAGEAFLAENGARKGVVTTDSGLQYEVLESASGEERPTAESTVKVHYHGTLINGSVFDSSVERGEPIEFPLSNVIRGWTEGLQLMAKGDKFRFVIPAELAYGDQQISPDIPPGSTLIFEVELIDFSTK